MENSSCSALECSLSSTSAKALNDSSRRILEKLDHRMPLTSEKGYSKDYRGLAGLMGFKPDEVRIFEKFADPTMKIYESWEIRLGTTIGQLFGYLEDMDRHDIIQDLLTSLKMDIAETQSSSPIQDNEVSSGTMILHSNRSFLTRDDVLNGECNIYDAYLCYADDEDDINAVFQFVQKLESPPFGLKLFIPDRDMLVGQLELDTDIQMIMHRCRHMLMVLTPNFIKNPTLAFLVDFATSLAIKRNENILIPVALEPCVIPPILSGVNRIDFSKAATNKFVQQCIWENLVLALKNNRTTTQLSNSADSISEKMD